MMFFEKPSEQDFWRKRVGVASKWRVWKGFEIRQPRSQRLARRGASSGWPENLGRVNFHNRTLQDSTTFILTDAFCMDCRFRVKCWYNSGNLNNNLGGFSVEISMWVFGLRRNGGKDEVRLCDMLIYKDDHLTVYGMGIRWDKHWVNRWMRLTVGIWFDCKGEYQDD